MITIDDFAKIDMHIGHITAAERVPNADKLLQLTVDFGDLGVRTVASAIVEYVEDPQTLVGVKCPFVTNLPPRTVRGVTSEAMIVAVHSDDGAFSVLQPTMADIPAGTRLN
jgi:methionyl-tRNA synthetase